MKGKRVARSNGIALWATLRLRGAVVILGGALLAAALPASPAHGAVAPATYHSGPVEHSSTVYAIFWAPNGTPFPAGYQTTVSKYLTDVALDSYKASNVYSVVPQYYDVVGGLKQPGFYAVAAKPIITDTRPYPANGCPNYVLADGTTSLRCLTNAQIINELKAVIAAKNLSTGLGVNYFLFTPRGVASCSTATSLATGGCYNPKLYKGYCAYHASFSLSTKWAVFGHLPYAAVNGCASGQSPQGNAADSVLNTLVHEHVESMTDPLGTAWYDSGGNEVADKCRGFFGTVRGQTAFGQYNQLINGHGYWLQTVWSNRAQGCVQRNNFPQPTASFSFTNDPAAPVHGQPVVFNSTSTNPDGTALKVRWYFPTVWTTLGQPTYTFPNAGTFTVTLLVWDAQGDAAKVQRTISVT